MKFASERCEFEDLQFSDIDDAVKLFTDDKVREYLGGIISEEEGIRRRGKFLRHEQE